MTVDSCLFTLFSGDFLCRPVSIQVGIFERYYLDRFLAGGSKASFCKGSFGPHGSYGLKQTIQIAGALA